MKNRNLGVNLTAEVNKLTVSCKECGGEVLEAHNWRLNTLSSVRSRFNLSNCPHCGRPLEPVNLKSVRLTLTNEAA